MYGKGSWRKMKGTATIRLPDGTICDAELHWYEAHGIGRKEVKIKKPVYPILPDEFGDQHDMIRLVDESGEDYLYSNSYFARVELPRSVQDAIEQIA